MSLFDPVPNSKSNKSISLRINMSAIFNHIGFYDHIYKFGCDIKYYQATLCNCIASNNGHPSPTCDCYFGYRYGIAPIEGKLQRTQVNLKGMPEQMAMMLQGGCQITVPKQTKTLVNGNSVYTDCDIFHLANIGDVFVIKNRHRRDRDILQKGVRDYLHAFDVQEIYSITNGTITYIEGTDFEFVKKDAYWSIPVNDAEDDMDLIKNKLFFGGEIIWLSGGSAPATNEHYTVEFKSEYQYIIWDDLSKDRGGDDDDLPKRFTCRLRQYINFNINPLDSLTI